MVASQLGSHLGQLGANSGPTWVNLGPSWANLGPTWGQVGANLGQHEGSRTSLDGPEGAKIPHKAPNRPQEIARSSQEALRRLQKVTRKALKAQRKPPGDFLEAPEGWLSPKVFPAHGNCEKFFLLCPLAPPSCCFFKTKGFLLEFLTFFLAVRLWCFFLVVSSFVHFARRHSSSN